MTGDHLRSSIVDSSYLTYLVQFDQIGEYAYQEWENSEIFQAKGKVDEVKMKMEEEIGEVLEACWKGEADGTSFKLMQPQLSAYERQSKERFAVIVDEKKGRDVFLSALNRRRLENELIFPSKDAYHNVSILVVEVLEKIERDADVSSALKLIDLCNHFFVQNDPVEEKGLPPRSYLSKVIESHQMFKDLGFWEKAIFESI